MLSITSFIPDVVWLAYSLGNSVQLVLCCQLLNHICTTGQNRVSTQWPRLCRSIGLLFSLSDLFYCPGRLLCPLSEKELFILLVLQISVIDPRIPWSQARLVRAAIAIDCRDALSFLASIVNSDDDVALYAFPFSSILWLFAWVGFIQPTGAVAHALLWTCPLGGGGSAGRLHITVSCSFLPTFTVG